MKRIETWIAVLLPMIICVFSKGLTVLVFATALQ
jgi:hypothetical protein